MCNKVVMLESLMLIFFCKKYFPLKSENKKEPKYGNYSDAPR